MNFEWDDEKDRINRVKHKVSFDTAMLAFDDPNAIELYDIEHSTEEEERFILIGLVEKVLTVVFTERASVTRIISARKATSQEVEMYYGNS